VLADIVAKKAIDDELKGRLTAAINDYKSTFLAQRKDQRKEKETAQAK
jgi:F-type H+-transporting ATPase subunit alpha